MAASRPGTGSLLAGAAGVFCLAVVLSGCANDPGGGSAGSGGSPATGGASGSPGRPGSGGASASGGARGSGGTGGAVATGGNIGSGGSSLTGGTVGAGGAAGSGAPGTGGMATGGSPATGGSGTGGRGTGGAAAGATSGTGGAGTGGAPAGDPPTKTVRVFWLRPSDVPDDTQHPDGIAKVMMEAQKFYKQELGKTFNLNTPVVQTVVGEHVRSWYENTDNGGDPYWYSVFNMRDELSRRFNLKDPDSRWIIVGEVSAEGPGAGGGGSPGWVMLPQHDADGAAGIGATFNRWCGGMVHELGHAFGLPDASSDDGTPMSAALYNYPDTHFNQAQKNSVLSGPYASFLF